jgi:hypothetical protein
MEDTMKCWSCGNTLEGLPKGLGGLREIGVCTSCTGLMELKQIREGLESPQTQSLVGIQELVGGLIQKLDEILSEKEAKYFSVESERWTRGEIIDCCKIPIWMIKSKEGTERLRRIAERAKNMPDAGSSEYAKEEIRFIFTFMKSLEEIEEEFKEVTLEISNLYGQDIFGRVISELRDNFPLFPMFCEARYGNASRPVNSFMYFAEAEWYVLWVRKLINNAERFNESIYLAYSNASFTMKKVIEAVKKEANLSIHERNQIVGYTLSYKDILRESLVNLNEKIESKRFWWRRDSEDINHCKELYNEAKAHLSKAIELMKCWDDCICRNWERDIRRIIFGHISDFFCKISIANKNYLDKM